jgi:hypothetical protein
MHQLRVDFRNRWHVLRSERDFKETDNQVMNNIDDCVRSAEIVVSVASSIVHSRSTVLGRNQRGSDIGQHSGDRTRLWVERINGLTLREDQGEENIASSSATSTTIMPPPTPSHTSAASTITVPPPTPDLASVGGRYAESTVTIPSTQAQVEAELDFFREMEPKLIETWFNIGKQKFDERSYTDASAFLEKVLDWVVKTAGSDTRVLVVHLLATCYSYMNQWAKAVEILSELRDDTQGAASQAETEHALAEINFYIGDLDTAEKWCRATVQGKARTLRTYEHESVYESISLLAEILEGKSCHVDAEGYKALIPPDILSIFS